MRYATASRKNLTGNVANLNPSESSYLIYGDVGVGKTYAAYAYYNQYAHNMVEYTRRPIVLSIARELQRIRDSFGSNESYAISLGLPSLVVLDDMDKVKPSPWVTEQLFILIDDIYMKEIPLIITMNNHPNKLRSLIGEASADRIMEICEVIHMQGKSRRVHK